MRKLLFGAAAIAAAAIVTPAMARPGHGGHGGHGWHGRGIHHGGGFRSFGPRIGIYAAPGFYDYAACPLVKVWRHGRVRYIHDC